jgi:hypothetical protein
MHVRTELLAWGLASLGAAGFLLLTGVARDPIPGTAAARPSVRPTVAAASEVQALAAGPQQRAPVLAPRVRAKAAEADVQRALRAPRGTERAFLEEFLALERARPGTLEERAGEMLSSVGPKAQKVALLHALERCGSQHHVAWLEHAARSLPDDDDAHGVSVARYALDQLAAAARTDAEALPTLRRLAFETRALSLDLRRSAALALAQESDEIGLGELRSALARESDPVLVAGVVEALRERGASPQAARLVAEYSPSALD